MKVAILAGGLGTRFSEEIAIKPKTLVETRWQLILWNIIKIYTADISSLESLWQDDKTPLEVWN